MNTNHQHWQELQKFKTKLDRKGIHWDTHTINRFTCMSAHMVNFLPMLSYEEHLKVFKKSIIQDWMNAMDIKLFADRFPWRIQGWDDFIEQISLEVGIIATFHFGAYQLINYLLARNDIPFALLVSERVVETWNTRNDPLLATLDEARAQGRFVLLNANDPKSVRKMYRLAAKGYYLVAYIDGLEGVEDKFSLKLENISFLGGNITVPITIARLATRLVLPVYPMLALRTKKSVHIKTLPIIWPSAKRSTRPYAAALIARCYGFLGAYVMRWPEQWANWPYLEAIRPDVHGREANWNEETDKSFDDPLKYGLWCTSKTGGEAMRKSDMKTYWLNPAQVDMLKWKWFGVTF